MRVGASRTAPDLTITAPHRSALAPAAQPRPASPRRALPSARVSKRVPIPYKSGVPIQCSLTRTLPLSNVGYENQTNEHGEKLIWLDRAVVDRLRSLRGPGESFGDVSLRLASESVV
jgi:hypothetical protein